MPPSDPTPVFPRAMSMEILIALGIFVALMAIAVFVDSRRRRKLEAQQVESQWRNVQAIARDKELTDEDLALLTEIVRRFAPQQPLLAITVREHFNDCVEKEMARLRSDRPQMEAVGARLRDIRMRLALDYIPLGQRISNTRDLFNGQTIWMASKEGERVRWYRFQVIDLNEAYFFATLHEEQAEAPNFEPSTELRCRMWREDDARYVFVVHFVRCEDEPAVYLFEHTGQLDRLQAREHFRIRLDNNVTIGILNAPVDDNYEDVHTRRAINKLRGRITSLSAGGCALVVPQALPKQVLLRVLLELPGAKPVEVEAAIVGTTAISGGRHLVRAQFVAVRDEVSDAIARYVMRRQQPLQPAAVEQSS